VNWKMDGIPFLFSIGLFFGFQDVRNEWGGGFLKKEAIAERIHNPIGSKGITECFSLGAADDTIARQ